MSRKSHLRQSNKIIYPPPPPPPHTHTHTHTHRHTRANAKYPPPPPPPHTHTHTDTDTDTDTHARMLNIPKFLCVHQANDIVIIQVPSRAAGPVASLALALLTMKSGRFNSKLPYQHFIQLFDDQMTSHKMVIWIFRNPAILLQKLK